MATNTETPSPTLSGSTTATRFWITPSASSFWMRFQQGVDDSPTRLPTSATDSEASCCSTPRILRSMASMPRSFRILGEIFDSATLLELMFLFGACICSYREEYSISSAESSEARHEHSFSPSLPAPSRCRGAGVARLRGGCARRKRDAAGLVRLAQTAPDGPRCARTRHPFRD